MPDPATGRDSDLPKVLLVSPKPPPYGGIARWTQVLLGMDEERLGAKLVLVDTAHRRQRSADTKLALRIVTGLGQWLRVTSAFLRQVARRPRPDCVHVNSSGSLGLVRDVTVLAVSRLRGIRAVLHLRFGRVPSVLASRKRAEARLLRLSLRLAERIISIDQRTQDAVAKEVGPSKALLIPNFIDVESYEPRYLGRSEKTVLFLGSVSESKGVGDLLDAWAMLPHADWTLLIAGPVSPAMESRFAALPDDANVKLLGALDHADAMTCMSAASIFVLPSHTEGFPNVLLEAMATGTPVVATSVGAIPEMLAEGAGSICPPRSVPLLAEALGRYMTDEAAREAAARVARLRVESEYSMPVVIARYRGVWRGQ